MKIEIVLEEIEALRKHMHKTALDKGISHREVLVLSQKLDEKMNEYDGIKQKEANDCNGSITKAGLTR